MAAERRRGGDRSGDEAWRLWSTLSNRISVVHVHGGITGGDLELTIGVDWILQH